MHHQHRIRNSRKHQKVRSIRFRCVLSSISGWKKKNREYCEACLDGGELICCEKCPLSYHPSCCDPPCDASDLPDKWICKVCLTQKLTLPENELNPLRILDFETSQMNPNVFDLEIDPLIQGLAGKIHLPGTTRTKPKNSKSKGVNKRELHEIDSAGLGIVFQNSMKK